MQVYAQAWHDRLFNDAQVGLRAAAGRVRPAAYATTLLPSRSDLLNLERVSRTGKMCVEA